MEGLKQELYIVKFTEKMLNMHHNINAKIRWQYILMRIVQLYQHLGIKLVILW